MACQKYRLELIAVFFTLLGLYLRFTRLSGRGLWDDEVLAVSQGLGPLKPFWQQLFYRELTSFPGHYLLTWPFVQVFGYNKWGLAIPHIAVTLLGFYFVYLICKKYLTSSFAQVIVFAVLCFNANLVFHAFEFRSYAVLAALGPAVYYFCSRLFEADRPLGAWQRLGIGVFLVLTVAYHAYGILIVGFCCAYFVMLECSRHPVKDVIQRHFVFWALVALFALPVFWWYATGNPGFNYELGTRRNINVFEYIANPIVDVRAFLQGVFGNLVGFKPFYPLLTGIGLAFLLPTRERAKQIGFFLLCVVLPILLICYGDTAKRYWFLQRQFVWLMPLFAYFLGWCWESVLMYFIEKYNDRKQRS